MSEENRPSEAQLKYANKLKEDLGEEGNKAVVEILKEIGKEQTSDFSELDRGEISKVINALKKASGYSTNNDFKPANKEKSSYGKDIIPLGELEKKLHEKYPKDLRIESRMEYISPDHKFFICKVTLETPDGHFEAYGDSSIDNTTDTTKNALPRMAESRGRGRVIKLALGIDCISQEELGDKK